MVQLLQEGSVTQNYRYDAYGYINANEFGIQAPFYGYNGEEQNPFTGLQYLRARYYAPQNGGFVTQDSFFGTLTDALTQNQYTYAGNNPVNFTDPSGHAFAFLGAEGAGSSASAKKVSAKAPSAVKKTTANTVASKAAKATTSSKGAVYGNSSSGYASGAAAAARNAYSSAGKGGTSGYGQKVSRAVANNPRVVKRNAKGVWQELPQHFSNPVEAAKEYNRHMCSSDMRRVETKNQKQQKGLAGVMDVVGNWWKENGATFMRGVGVTVVGALAVTTAIAALPAVALFGTAGAIVTFGTLAVGTFTTTMGVQDMAAAVIPYQPLKDIVNSPTYTAIENIATAGSIIGAGMTAPMAAVGQLISKGATQQAAQQNAGNSIKSQPSSTPRSDSEIYYRTMSPEDYDQLRTTGELPPTSETFISPSPEYAQQYSGVTVRLETQSGTTAQLETVGFRNGSSLVSQAYPDMPKINGVTSWTEVGAFFKGESGQINIGLGQGLGLEIFNRNLIGFEQIGG